ncbi:hypothetical protein Taro_012293, partial [Colocasia esculenta]|nr:hypothetical protein [Colocasia esculenta]
FYCVVLTSPVMQVTDQNLDIWPKSPACVKDGLRHYYYQYLSSTADAAQEKILILQEKDKLLKETERLTNENESLQKSKDLADGHLVSLRKLLESTQRELKDKETLVQDLKQSLELQRKELNECRAEITSLKMHIESERSGQGWVSGRTEQIQSTSLDNHIGEKVLQIQAQESKEDDGISRPVGSSNVDVNNEEKVIWAHEDSSLPVACISEKSDVVHGNFEGDAVKPNTVTAELQESLCDGDITIENDQRNYEKPSEPLSENSSFLRLDSPRKAVSDKNVSAGLETIQILSDALPKIVPYVLINHREACVTLAKNVGEMRTETELLPQCWEQINHVYEERRMLVAQSCGELAEFVRPEIRDSLILSIVQQLVEDPAAVVRQAAAHNLALLLPCFPTMDKYFKVEELMFQLVCDPSGFVVEASIKELLPSVIKWGKKLDHILRVLFSHLLGSAQRCPPLSGVEGSVDSHLRVLGERERWNVDVLLRMLTELLPFIYSKAVETCPFTSSDESLTSSGVEKTLFTLSILELYAGGHVEWPAFDWLHVDCFPDLIQLACLLPTREDNLRTHITKFLLATSEAFGDQYVMHIMLPIFLVATGDDADLRLFPSSIQSRIKGLCPRTAVTERLAVMCVLPLLLAGIFGSHGRSEQLAEYLRKLLVQSTMKESPRSSYHATDLIDAVRFLCTFEEHHGIIFNILWEMVVSSNANMKINAANLLKVLVPYIDVKVASTHVLPALVTLGSDQNLNVKYASIDAFGAVAQHFKNDMIVEKIRVQMDAFLEDGSHEATVAVVRALMVAIPHTTEKLRDYILYHFYNLPSASVKDLLLPAIQNLLKDTDAVDPAHKEALEVIMKDRSGGTLETISKVMGAHLGIASSVSSFFGEGGLLGKKESDSQEAVVSPHPVPPAVQEDTRFRRIMRGNFGDMLRAKAKGQDDTPQG